MDIKIQPAYFFCPKWNVNTATNSLPALMPAFFYALKIFWEKIKKIFKFVGTFLLFNLVLYMKGQSVSKNILQKYNQKESWKEGKFWKQKTKKQYFAKMQFLHLTKDMTVIDIRISQVLKMITWEAVLQQHIFLVRRKIFLLPDF